MIGKEGFCIKRLLAKGLMIAGKWLDAPLCACLPLGRGGELHSALWFLPSHIIQEPFDISLRKE